MGSNPSRVFMERFSEQSGKDEMAAIIAMSIVEMQSRKDDDLVKAFIGHAMVRLEMNRRIREAVLKAFEPQELPVGDLVVYDIDK